MENHIAAHQRRSRTSPTICAETLKRLTLHKPATNRVWQESFDPAHLPARATIGVADLGPGVRLEMIGRLGQGGLAGAPRCGAARHATSATKSKFIDSDAIPRSLPGVEPPRDAEATRLARDLAMRFSCSRSSTKGPTWCSATRT